MAYSDFQLPVYDRVNARTQVQPHSAATLILMLVSLRWMAGILENYGANMLSQLAALSMLGAFAIMFLFRMRVAAESALFVAGALAWFFSGLLSFAANPHTDLVSTLSLLSLLLLYALFANAMTTHLRSQWGVFWLSRLLSVFVVVGTFLALVQVLSGAGFVEIGREAEQRAFGSDVHPVSFAIQILAAMVALEICRAKQNKYFGPAHVLLLTLGCLALYLTLARTAWVMGFIVVAGWAVFSGPPMRRIISAAAIFASVIVTVLVSDRFADLASLPNFLNNFSMTDGIFDWRYVDNSVSWRIVNWTIGLAQGLQQPLLGFGPGQSANSSFFNLEMHNIFLETFVEGGIVGLLTFILTLAGLIRMHIRLPKKTAADRHCKILTNSFGLALFLAVTFSTSFVDQLMSFLIYFALLTACSVGAVPARRT